MAEQVQHRSAIRLLPIILGIAILLLNGCSGRNNTENTDGRSDDTLCVCPPSGLVVELQPMGDFSRKEAEQLEKELTEHVYNVYGIASGGIAPTIKMPASCYYAPRKRYWAGKLLRYIHSEADVTIGLTHQDISTSIHGQYNYGIMGLSLRPGKASIVSTYRVKHRENRWKVTAHEFFHACGLPHCPKDNPHCLMQDAHGKDTFNQKECLCKDCEKALRKILFGDAEDKR